MRKQFIMLAASVILGVAAVLSFSDNKSDTAKPGSPKCAKNCTKTKKPAPATTGFFIVDSYQGVL
jgi:hypothetical protein